MNKGVLIIYTGGTIGSIQGSGNNASMYSASWDLFEQKVKVLKNMKKHFKIDSYAFSPPIDSANITPEYWREIVGVIEKNYNNYEGFVVIHGTDTMVYTASSLSFMLKNLGKPVIITGSQLPIIDRLRSDGEQNLITSLLLANPKFSDLPVVPEVCILFGNKLLRGNRSRKISASGFNAFDSPNYPPIAIIGENISINTNLTGKIPKKNFSVQKNLDPNVISFPVFPGIQNSKLMSKLFQLENLKAVVLRSYGTGTVPTDNAFINEIKHAANKGIIIVNVTQCIEGAVKKDVYETSASLISNEILTGYDITQEAALCKLMVLLGDKSLDSNKIKKVVQTSIAGELTKEVL